MMLRRSLGAMMTMEGLLVQTAQSVQEGQKDLMEKSSRGRKRSPPTGHPAIAQEDQGVLASRIRLIVPIVPVAPTAPVARSGLGGLDGPGIIHIHRTTEHPAAQEDQDTPANRTRLIGPAVQVAPTVRSGLGGQGMSHILGQGFQGRVIPVIAGRRHTGEKWGGSPLCGL